MGQSLRDMRRSSDRQPARSVGRRLLRQSLRHHQRAMINIKAMLPRSDASTITAACRCAELSHVVRELSVRRATESQLKEPSSSTDLRQLRSATFKLSQGGLEQVRLNGKAPECRPRDRAWLERHARCTAKYDSPAPTSNLQPTGCFTPESIRAARRSVPPTACCHRHLFVVEPSATMSAQTSPD